MHWEYMNHELENYDMYQNNDISTSFMYCICDLQCCNKETSNFLLGSFYL